MEPKTSENPSVQEESGLAESGVSKILKSKLLILFLAIILITALPLVIFFSTKQTPVGPQPEPTQIPEPTGIVTPTFEVKPTLPPFPEKGGYVENELIIEYKEGMSPDELTDNGQRSRLAQALADAGVISQKKLYQSLDPKLKNFYVLTFQNGVDVQEVSKIIYQLPEIKGVEPNGKASIF